jgi:phosphoglycerol geranylgeranyltransferase
MSGIITNHPIWLKRRVHLLIDPDKWHLDELEVVLRSIPEIVGSIIVGGTYLHSDQFGAVMECCSNTKLPIGNIVSVGISDSIISQKADYLLVPILFGSTSTRFVLDHLIRAVPVIRHYGLPCIPYAYFMLAGGAGTSAEYFTQTIPIPRGKPDVLTTLSLAARYLGLQGIYLEAGSGALYSVTTEEIEGVVKFSGLPVLVGGGISSASTCHTLFGAGTTGIIIGTAIEQEKNLSFLEGL